MVPIESMGLLYLPIHLVDLYGKCTPIYQSHGSYGVYSVQETRDPVIPDDVARPVCHSYRDWMKRPYNSMTWGWE